MNQELSSNLDKYWNEAVNSYKGKLRNYLEILNNKQSDCEDELHQLVTNTSIKFSERKHRTLELMEQQEKVNQLIDELETILLDKGDTV
ncbi:hypothetical protein [Bacillus salipaludis]|uniref:Uncharacterized protein n=1 Tax=Bacillus salipaludis TaxID=2547811 RepID=A0AA90TSQ6_9BACI|nr:hypothetical protein [Bacillus salipaludis]MDQ6598095.1 hypothetical protein [Bacillus salipaludis]